MQNLIKNKNGMTIIEVLIAITLMAVISIMIFMGYFTVVAINKDTQRQIDYNAMTRTLKETFASYIKNASTTQKLSVYQDVMNASDMATDDTVDLYDQVSKKLYNTIDKIAIKDGSGNIVYTDFYYEYRLMAGPGSTPVSIDGATAPYSNTYMFEIKVKKRENPPVIVQELSIYINKLP